MFMNRGIDRVEAMSYVKMQIKLAEYFRDSGKRKSFLKVYGLRNLKE
jgi:hypothetical protein